MAIPIYRHNQDHDDWEVASIYDSDDCDSMGRSAYGESVHSSGSPDDPVLRVQDRLYDDARPVVRYSVPQQQPQNYPPVAFSRPRWDARYAPGRQSNFIVPPPGVIFPSKELAHPPPQNTYWPSAPSQIASASDRPTDVGLAEPPPPTLLLSPCSPPRTSPPPLIPPHMTSTTVSGTGTNVNTYASPVMQSPPRYHDLVHTHPMSPHLAEAGCQAHSGMAMSPRRRTGHDVLSLPSPCAPGPGHGSRHASPSSEETKVADGRYGGGGGSGLNYEPDRPDLRPLAGKYKYEREYDYGGRVRTARPQTRERRPSIWRRFVRRFSPHVSVGQT